MKKKYIVRICVFALLICMCIPLLATPKVAVEAAARLYGVQQVVDGLINNDFNILEIVPDNAYKSFGFVVANSIPEIDDKLIAAGNSEINRRSLLQSYFAGLKSRGIIDYDDNLYTERLYTINGDDYRAVVVSEDEEYFETRRGSYIKAALVPGSYGNYMYSPAVDLTISLKSATRNGTALSLDDYSPAVGDTIVLTLNIAANHANVLNGRTITASLKNAANNFVITNTSTVSYSGHTITTNTADYEVSVDCSYTIAEADANKTLEFQFSTENKYYSNICSAVIPANNSLNASLTFYSDTPTTSTVTLTDVSFYNGAAHANVKVAMQNTSSHNVRSSSAIITFPFDISLDSVYTGTVTAIDSRTIYVVSPIYSEYDEVAPGASLSDIGFAVSTTDPDAYTRYMNGETLYTIVDQPVLNLDYTVQDKALTASETATLACGSNTREVHLYDANVEYRYTHSLPVTSATGNTAVSLTYKGKTYTQNISYSNTQGAVQLSEASTATGVIAFQEYVNEVYIDDFIPAPGIGTYVWVDDPTGTEANVYFNTLYCSIKYTGCNKFASDILELSPFVESEYRLYDRIKVFSYTPDSLVDALRYNQIALSDIDLVYISSSSALNIPSATLAKCAGYSLTNDIDWETAYNLFEYISNTGLPVIVDRNVLNDWSEYDTNLSVPSNPSPLTGTPVTASANYPVYGEPAGVTAAKQLMADGCNITRLAYLLRHMVVNAFVDVPTSDESVWTVQFINNIVKCGYGNGVNVDYGKYGAVTANIYINGLRSGSNQVNMLNADINNLVVDYWEGFTKDIETETRLRGAKNIAGEIEIDNFYNNANGEVCTSDYEVVSGYERISIYGHSFLRYIINYARKRVVLYKDKIKILDIEPTKFSTLTVDKIKQWIDGTTESSKILEYEIVQMNTYEFVGKIEDIIEEYDLIYIGSCIGNGSTMGSMYQSGGKTTYNDSSLNGLIYTHMGDRASSIPNKYAGLLDSEQSALNASSSKIQVRYSGNDITGAKYTELARYAIAGYPVVIAEEFFKSDGTINTAYVDPYSNMYNFMSLVVEGGTFTYTQRDGDDIITQSKTISSLNNVMKEKNEVLPWLIKYINMPKLTISMVEWPTDYSISEDANGLIQSVTYLEPVNGVYTLRYTFEISNSAETRPSVANYRVRLFTDTNADGKFNDLEELDDLSIVETDTNLQVNADQLKTGIRYTITRELPENFVGMVPWKLQVETADVTAHTAHSSIKGYTAIRARTEAVNVLQINGTYFTQYNLNLQTNTQFQQLINNLRDKMGYDIRITTTDTTAIVNEYNNGKKNGKYSDYNDFYNTYMSEYDMLILGFEDCYSDIASDDVIMAVQSFITSGKSVLFSHDTTSYINFPESKYNSSRIPDVWKYWGYHMNTFVRSLVGMDRFGITDSALLKSLTANVAKGSANYDQIIADATAASKDIAYLPDGSIAYLTHGYNNYELCNNLPSGQKPFIVNGRQSFGDRTYAITQLNKGQITSYPFALNLMGDDTRTASGSYMVMNHTKQAVAQTHSQYYQLNMDMDKDMDGEPDLVVWYCLADKIYDAVPNDAVNGYYIYSLGNVTYTGMGHFQDSNSSANKIAIQEAKLFLNTMVASFNSGLKSPSLAITANAGDKNSTVEYIYRTYDVNDALEGNVDENIGIYVKDANIVQAIKDVYYWFYYEVSESAYNAGVGTHPEDYAAILDGNTPIYLKAYSKNESDSDYYGNVLSLDTSTAGYLDTGLIKNDKIVGVTIKSSWIEEQMNAARENGGSVKIYVAAWSKLTYAQNGNIVKTTTKSFSHLTFKERELFDMD